MSRRTEDGTYPNVEEERAKMEERAAAAATVSETSTTWEHGHVKCIMHTETRGGATTRTVKVIDMRPRPKHHGMQPNTQWEGTFEEFLQYTSSLDKLFPLLTAKRHEGAAKSLRDLYPPALDEQRRGCDLPGQERLRAISEGESE